MGDWFPADEQDVAEAVASSLVSQSPLEILGAGTRRGFGRPVEASAPLSTSKLSGIEFYEPAELVLCARAGTPLAELDELLDRQGQELAFEPIDHGRFYGGPPNRGTIGGLVAANASGPRRLKAGAARDHVLGFRAVTGRGDVVKSGGRVMKNVTGYDLSKLMAGSHGTLAVLTEVTLKVLPKPEAQITILVSQRDEAAALALLREASGLPLEFSGLALTPAKAEAAATAAFRLEGSRLSVEGRRDDFLAHLPGGRAELLPEAESRAYWLDVRDGGGVRACKGQVWRLSVAPSEGRAVVEALKSAGAPIEAYCYDWAGGLVWLALETAPDAHAGLIRSAVDRVGGHATLMRAQDAVRSLVPVFHPQPAALAALTKRVKESFDPLRLLGRGRMRADL
jgi:glycolate oxidase FAD binding subunit